MPEAPHNICLETTEDELYRVLIWLDEEWPYVAGKFGGVCSGNWDHLPDDRFINEWTRQVVQYADRAMTFGLEDIRGRQAIAKLAATALAFAGSTVRIRGELPRGGTASGVAEPR
jgi:hypothetical protein